MAQVESLTTAGIIAKIAEMEAKTVADLLAGLSRSNVGLSEVNNTADINKPVSIAQAAADALKISLTEKGVPSGVSTLGVNGIVPFSQLPPIVAVNVQTFITSGTWTWAHCKPHPC